MVYERTEAQGTLFRTHLEESPIAFRAPLEESPITFRALRSPISRFRTIRTSMQKSIYNRVDRRRPTLLQRHAAHLQQAVFLGRRSLCKTGGAQQWSEAGRAENQDDE